MMDSVKLGLRKFIENDKAAHVWNDLSIDNASLSHWPILLFLM